jgi:DNA processing protein
LAYGVLVIEAAMNSGSLITANYALEQGREVFALPGLINNPKIKGCHQLIKQGAKLVDDLADIVEELAPLLQHAIHDKTAAKPLAKLITPAMPDSHERLLSKIDYEATCVDVIAGRSGLAANTVTSLLLELELTGLIESVPGGFARRLS